MCFLVLCLRINSGLSSFVAVQKALRVFRGVDVHRMRPSPKDFREKYGPTHVHFLRRISKHISYRRFYVSKDQYFFDPIWKKTIFLTLTSVHNHRDDRRGIFHAHGLLPASVAGAHPGRVRHGLRLPLRLLEDW